jgi:metal-responsive CopG/Arc/MetJ family transcriptional regulator
MKVKTSITLSGELLREIDSAIRGAANRPSFIEAAIKSYLLQKKREMRDSSDLEILNEHSAKLNKEAGDVLPCQVTFETRRSL